MVERVIKACPICGGDVKGNKKYRYFCKKCNILYTKKELLASREQLEKHVKKTLVKKIDSKMLKKIHEDNLLLE